jgi:uncharacterized protein YndB with AHSA1/START domain
MGGTATVVGTVPRSADDVFGFLTDLDRLQEWNAIMTAVVERPAALEAGVEWVVELKALGSRWRSRSRVEEYNPEQRVFTYRSGTDDGNPSYAIWRWVWIPTPRAGPASRSTGSCTPRPSGDASCSRASEPASCVERCRSRSTRSPKR